MAHDAKDRRSERIFRRLLRLYPFDFRWDFGREMQHVFREQHREVEAEGGLLKLIRLWWDTVAGIVTTAPREHWDMLRQDLRYGLRLLRRNPGFTLAAVLALGLGIGATSAILTVVDAVLLRPLPFPEQERLVMVWETDAESGSSGPSATSC